MQTDQGVNITDRLPHLQLSSTADQLDNRIHHTTPVDTKNQLTLNESVFDDEDAIHMDCSASNKEHSRDESLITSDENKKLENKNTCEGCQPFSHGMTVKEKQIEIKAGIKQTPSPHNKSFDETLQSGFTLLTSVSGVCETILDRVNENFISTSETSTQTSIKEKVSHSGKDIRNTVNSSLMSVRITMCNPEETSGKNKHYLC